MWYHMSLKKYYVLMNIITTNIRFNALQCNEGFLSARYSYGLLNTLMVLLDRPNLNCVNT